MEDKTVKYIAELARLHLKQQETNKLAKDLDEILKYIKKLEKLDVSQTQPTSHIFSLKNVFRADVEHKSLTQQDALQSAADQQEGMFKVPQVIE